MVPVGQTVKDKDRLGIDRAHRLGRFGGAPRFITLPISLLELADEGYASALGRTYAHDQLDLMLNVLGKLRHEGGPA